jgi:hypothetical protein
VLDTGRFFADPVASAEPAPRREQDGIDLDKTDLTLDARSVSRERSDTRKFVTRRIADETIIVPVVGGVGDLDAIFTLNEVGSLVWQLTDTPTTVHAIVEEIARTFDVPSDQAERDVVEFLGKLEEAGLIRPLNEPTVR